MKRLLTRLMMLLFTIYALAGLYLYLLQQQMLYPVQPSVSTPFMNETFSHQGETINAIVLNPENKSALLYFGGNAEIVSQTAFDFSKDYPNHTIYFVEYRGYGNSSGKPSQDALYADAEFIFDQLSKRHEHITVLGRSMGTGVATHLATHRAFDKLVLVTPYDSVLNLAQSSYPIFPIALLLKDHHDSINRVAQITIPTLIFTAEFDTTIPEPHTSALIEAYPKEKLTVVHIKNVDHNSVLDHPQYHQSLQKFL